MVVSLLDTYLSKSAPQNLLLSEGEFVRYAKDRGLHIRQEDLEYFEERGFLFPLCRIKLPVIREYPIEGEIRREYAPLMNISHNLLKWYENGFCEDPTKTEFRPWQEYKDGYHQTARTLYHPWQFINLKSIVHSLGHNLSVEQILEEERLEKIQERVRKFWGSQGDWVDFIVQTVNENLRFLSFLISIEDLYLPLVRSSFIEAPWKSDDGFEIWKSFKARFDPKDALSKYCLAVEQLEEWRKQIAVMAMSIDPLRDWYLLVRHINYNKRRKLRGDALFAQDCYEIAEVLGQFLEELTGKTQYDPDDLLDGGHGEWKKRFYGTEVDFANRDVLRQIVYEYGLDYDYRMLFFVEGETEYHAIPIIADAMGISFTALGIRLEKLGGYSEIAPKRIKKLLQYAKSVGMIAYVIIDNHRYAKEYVDELIAQRDLPMEGEKVRIWNIDFEEDNFTIDELIEATKQAAAKEGASISLTTEMVKEKYASSPKKGISNILVTICEEQMYHLSKPNLGRELGLIVAERIKRGKTGTTKIENELMKVAEALYKMY
jgi:hypothetical protein